MSTVYRGIRLLEREARPMPLHDLRSTYLALTRNSRLLFLVDLAWELTVHARGTYVAGTEEVAKPQKLRTFNEIQHRVLGHLRHLMYDQDQRYPEPEFFDVICAAADEVGMDGHIAKILLRNASPTSPAQTAQPRRTA